MEINKIIKLLELSNKLLDIMEEPLKIQLQKKQEEKEIIKSFEVDIYKKSYKNPFYNDWLPQCVLRIIFQHLSGMDLLNVMMVCRSWLEAVNSEKRLRKPYLFGISINVYEITRKYLFHQSKDEIIRQTLYPIKMLPIKPSIGLFYETFESVFERDIEGDIYKSLPENCETIMLYNNDICPNLYKECLFLPHIPGVRIKAVKITEETWTNTIKLFLQMFKGVAKRTYKTSTCLILFCSSYAYDIKLDDGIYTLLAKYFNKIIASLWGGVVTKIRCVKTDNQGRSNVTQSDCVALIITGFIQTWSVVLNYKSRINLYDNLLYNIKESLKSFRGRVHLQNHSVGFMFVTKFTRPNVDSDTISIFKNLFPEVPLLIFYGKSIFGTNTDQLPRCMYLRPTSDAEMRNQQEFIKISTSIMILTYD